MHPWNVRAITFTPVMLQVYRPSFCDVASSHTFSQKLLILQVGYPPAIMFTKLSLFQMYLRIFSPDLRTRYLIYFGITLMVLFYTACLLTETISCTPRSGETWLDVARSKRCGKDLTLGYLMAAFNVLSDFYLLAIPIPVIWKLHLPLQ